MKKPRFLDLTVPLTKNSVYKDSSQGKAWGFDSIIWRSHFILVFLSREFLENIFLKGKRRTIPDLIYQIENPTLGALSYLHVGVQLGGTRIRTENNFGSWLGGTW